MGWPSPLVLRRKDDQNNKRLFKFIEVFTCAPYLETKEIDAVIFRVVFKWNIYVASDPDPAVCSVFVFSLLSSLIICSD